MRLVSILYNECYPFESLPGVTAIKHVTDPSELQAGDVIIVWGGADISPSLYNKDVSRYCGATATPSRRDRIEWQCMHRAKELGIPIIGICRGAQMLCALAGGYLIQDVNHHAGAHHVVTTPTGYEFVTNSAHHQMMYPYDVRHEMLASIKPARGTFHFDVNDLVVMEEEPEAVYFPEVKGLAAQWHPEWMDREANATKFLFEKFKEKFQNA